MPRHPARVHAIGSVLPRSQAQMSQTPARRQDHVELKAEAQLSFGAEQTAILWTVCHRVPPACESAPKRDPARISDAMY